MDIINNEAKKVSQMQHSLELFARNKVIMTGIENVTSSTEELINLITTEGALELRGKGLKIQKFNVQDGSLTVEGTLDSFKYAAVKAPILKRLFK